MKSWAVLGVVFLCLFVVVGAGSAPGGLPRQLHGTMIVKSFTLPRGRTALVSGNLRLIAKGNIDIKGTLLVKRGVSLTLRAGGTLTIEGGGVKPAPTGKAGRKLASASRASRAEFVDNYDGQEVSVRSPLTAPPDTSIALASSPSGFIVITAPVTAGDGLPSTNDAASGDDGGDVIAVGGFGKAQGIGVLKGGSLTAGDGGNGYSEKLGHIDGSPNPCKDSGVGSNRYTLNLAGTDGGKGGSVRLLAHLIQIGGKVTVGDGGNGGNVGQAQAPSGGVGQGGADVHAVSGSGGNGGSFEASEQKDAVDAGVGGNAGDILVAAGDGGQHCDGGRTSVYLGKPGKNGASGAAPLRNGARGSIRLDDGGAGGPSESPQHDGGDGGATQVFVRKVNGKPAVESITIGAYANGGMGYADCVTTPTTNGTAGGKGALLTIGAAPAHVQGSFNGADGGDGDGPGAGGPAGASNGSALISTASFKPGKPGNPCRGIIAEDDTWDHNAALGKSNVCINVRTTPAQASATVTLSGPNGYTSSSPDKTPLIDGARQFISEITQPGDYTKTITVYDATGKQTATVTKTFTVAAPPKNGPTSTPSCPAPTG